MPEDQQTKKLLCGGQIIDSDHNEQVACCCIVDTGENEPGPQGLTHFIDAMPDGNQSDKCSNTMI
jgi:hypothetical protein